MSPRKQLYGKLSCTNADYLRTFLWLSCTI